MPRPKPPDSRPGSPGRRARSNSRPQPSNWPRRPSLLSSRPRSAAASWSCASRTSRPSTATPSTRCSTPASTPRRWTRPRPRSRTFAPGSPSTGTNFRLCRCSTPARARSSSRSGTWRQLREALARPPLAATPAQLWRAFEAVEAQKVAEALPARRSAGEALADLVQLVRHALKPAEEPLLPYAEAVRSRYAAWRWEQEQGGVNFTEEQGEWLDRMAEHLATSLHLEPADFETGWFGQQGSLGRAHALFGERLPALMAELNERLAA
ncbi:MAG: hypothetical protein HYW07_16930 [Candidatus Latescibacteria bacterium]|nr:hypothetical protein [Candidatus Latescibacterota bacterium]